MGIPYLGTRPSSLVLFNALKLVAPACREVLLNGFAPDAGAPDMFVRHLSRGEELRVVSGHRYGFEKVD